MNIKQQTQDINNHQELNKQPQSIKINRNSNIIQGRKHSFNEKQIFGQKQPSIGYTANDKESKLDCNEIRNVHKHEQYELQHGAMSNQERLQILKCRISLSGAQLLDLTYERNNAKFKNIIRTLEKQALSFILTEDLEEALVYLSEAQRILDYAASCGKTIERAMIISILHNQAYLYQRMERFQDALTYLQALIFNLIAQEDAELHFEMLNAIKYQSNFSELRSAVSNKQKIFSYQLQSCAMSSQIGDHEAALKASKQSIFILQQSMQIYCLLQKQRQKQSEFDQKQWVKAFKVLSKIQPNLQPQKYDTYLNQAAILVQNLSKNTQKNIYQSENQYQQNPIQKVQQLPIEKLMEIIPTSIEKQVKDSSIPTSQYLNNEDFLMIIIKFSVSYFSVGNQLRFVGSQSINPNIGFRNGIDSQDNYLNSQEYKLSQLYHLYSIIILVLYIPCQSLYLEHLLSTYTQIYGIDLRYLQVNLKVMPQDVGTLSSGHDKTYKAVSFQLKLKGQYQKQNIKIIQNHGKSYTKIIELQAKKNQILNQNSGNQISNNKSQCQQPENKQCSKQISQYIQPHTMVQGNFDSNLLPKSAQKKNHKKKLSIFNLSFKKDSIYTKRKTKYEIDNKKVQKSKNKKISINSQSNNINLQDHSRNQKQLSKNKSLEINHSQNKIKSKIKDMKSAKQKHLNQESYLILFHNSRLKTHKSRSSHKVSNSKSRQTINIRTIPAKSNYYLTKKIKSKSKDKSTTKTKVQQVRKKQLIKIQKNSQSCKIIMRKVKGAQNRQILPFQTQKKCQNSPNAINRSQQLYQSKMKLLTQKNKGRQQKTRSNKLLKFSRKKEPNMQIQTKVRSPKSTVNIRQSKSLQKTGNDKFQNKKSATKLS